MTSMGGLRNQVAGVGVGGETIPICIGAKGRVGVERDHGKGVWRDLELFLHEANKHTFITTTNDIYRQLRQALTFSLS